MADKIAVADLAGQLGLKSADVIAFAKSQGMQLNRAAALLTAVQEKTLRDAYADGRMSRRYVPPRQQRREDPTSAKHTRCECCALPAVYMSDHLRPKWCDECLDHYPHHAESDDRVIRRLGDHADSFKTKMAAAARRSAQNKAQADRGYRSRDLWRRTLVEMALAHEAGPDGKCVCGGGKFPCVSRRVLVTSNLGIAKQIERLEGLPEEDFLKVLYGEMPGFEDWDATDR